MTQLQTLKTNVLRRMREDKDKHCMDYLHISDSFCALGIIYDEYIKLFPEGGFTWAEPTYSDREDLYILRDPTGFESRTCGFELAYRLNIVGDLFNKIVTKHDVDKLSWPDMADFLERNWHVV